MRLSTRSCAIGGARALAETQLRTADMPGVLWIELTSRCPFDCVFCSRRLLRGKGQHLDIALYRRVLAELAAPRIIRLNYSGESTHYPHVIEAVALAAATGAEVELVSALASLPLARLELLLQAGLSRLTVSLHTLDPKGFEEIYGFASLDAMRDRLDWLRDNAARRARPGFVLDFAFVAMQRNLDQLGAVAQLAAAHGAAVLAVHPVIRRDPIPETFAQELDAQGQLLPAFRDRLAAAIADAEQQAAPLRIALSTAELRSTTHPIESGCAWPGMLPDGYAIGDCDQSPWDTVHVLADGSVVSCEVRDRIVLGSLRETSLREIWHGDTYRRFRADYFSGTDAHCRSCPYKRVFRPAPPRPQAGAAQAGIGQFVRGWFLDEGNDIVWSGTDAALLLDRGSGRALRLRGLLPPSPGGDNQLQVVLQDQLLGTIANPGADMLGFDRSFALSRTEGPLHLRFSVSHAHRPSMHGGSSDSRALGFALIEAAIR